MFFTWQLLPVYPFCLVFLWNENQSSSYVPYLETFSNLPLLSFVFPSSSVLHINSLALRSLTFTSSFLSRICNLTPTADISFFLFRLYYYLSSHSLYFLLPYIYISNAPNNSFFSSISYYHYIHVPLFLQSLPSFLCSLQLYSHSISVFAFFTSTFPHHY